jgi:hypothetical protein
MLNPTSLINKHIRSVKVRSQYYIKNRNEPKDNLSHDTLANDETILTESSAPMRRRFRHIAQQIRIIKKAKHNKGLESKSK